MHNETCPSRCDILLRFDSRIVTCFDLKLKASTGSSGLVRNKLPFPHGISSKMKNENNESLPPTGGFKAYFSHQPLASVRAGSGDGSYGIKQSGGQESKGPEAGGPAVTCQNKVIASDLPRVVSSAT